MHDIQLSVVRNGLRFPIQGQVAPGFEAFVQAFVANFRYDEDQGASAAAYVGGQRVAWLWGGYRDAALTRPWAEDTLVCTMSVGKAIAATGVHWLVEQGVLDLDRPVAHYWPEFGAAGKASVLLRWVLDHRAGVPALDVEAPPGALYDWDWMTRQIARQAPEWPPGEVAAYHVLTQGFILGEVVRRAAGRTLAEVVRTELAGPLGADFHFGVGAQDLARCAEVLPMTEPRGTMFDREAHPRSGVLWRGALQLFGEHPFNTEAYRRAEITSANGHSHGLGLATLFGMLGNGGELGGRRLLSATTIARMASVQHTQVERAQGRPYRQGLGVLGTSYPATWFGPGERSFGHHGVGGSVGFADPERRLGFGYATAKFHSRGDTGTRSRRLAEAVYAALDER